MVRKTFCAANYKYIYILRTGEYRGIQEVSELERHGFFLTNRYVGLTECCRMIRELHKDLDDFILTELNPIFDTEK